jgi:class 3 adenylate cyclase
MDIRNSTSLTKKYGVLWEQFIAAWITEASATIEKHGGHFVKSAGDAVLGAFGVFDDSEDTDYDTIGPKEAAAAERTRLSFLLAHSLDCLDDLFSKFSRLAEAYFPEERIVVCGGIDRGFIKAGVRGGYERKEFDVWGDTVNVAAKIESLSKVYLKQYPLGTNLLIISPYASDFLIPNESFLKVNVPEGIGNEGIKWVYIRAYAHMLSANKIAS